MRRGTDDGGDDVCGLELVMMVLGEELVVMALGLRLMHWRGKDPTTSIFS